MKRAIPREGLLHLLIIYLVWGSTFLVIRVNHQSEDGFPPFLLATTRLLVSGVILLSVAHFTGKNLRLNLSQFKTLLLTAILLWVGGHALVIWGEQKLDSGYAALIFGSMPLWALVFHSLHMRGKNLSFGLVFSALVGFAGIAILSLPNLSGAAMESRLHFFALLVAPASWALGTILQTGEVKKVPAVASAGYQQIFGGLSCGIFALINHEIYPQWNSSVYLGLGYLTLVASVIAFGSYIRVLQILPTNWVMSFAYVNPLIAVSLGAVVLHEPITGFTVTGMVFIIAGVAGLFRFG